MCRLAYKRPSVVRHSVFNGMNEMRLLNAHCMLLIGECCMQGFVMQCGVFDSPCARLRLPERSIRGSLWWAEMNGTVLKSVCGCVCGQLLQKGQGLHTQELFTVACHSLCFGVPECLLGLFKRN